MQLSASEEHVLRAVQIWVKEGRSSRARTPLSELLDDGDWHPPRIDQAHYYSGPRAWAKLCWLRALAVQRGQLADLRALFRHIEGVEADFLAVRRGLGLAFALIQQTTGRERTFVRKRRLDRYARRPENVEEVPQLEPC